MDSFDCFFSHSCPLFQERDLQRKLQKEIFIQRSNSPFLLAHLIDHHVWRGHLYPKNLPSWKPSRKTINSKLILNRIYRTGLPSHIGLFHIMFHPIEFSHNIKREIFQRHMENETVIHGRWPKEINDYNYLIIR